MVGLRLRAEGHVSIRAGAVENCAQAGLALGILQLLPGSRIYATASQGQCGAARRIQVP